MKMRDLKRSAYKAMHQAMAESREVGKAQERERIMNLLNANSENSVNGNSEIPETASNSPDTNPNVTAATQDYFAGMTRGRIEERWRIIELMQDLIEDSAEIPWWNPIHKQYTLDLIDLIKGEQK